MLKIIFNQFIQFGSPDELWSFLKMLKLEPETRIACIQETLSLKQLITAKWIRQQYLATEIIDKQTKECVFRWGFRAEHEVNKKDLLKWVCTLYCDDAGPQAWREQFQYAKDSEKDFQKDIVIREPSQS